MDQNRCLLDVIDNPQLLQSFLESESSAETSASNNIQLAKNNAISLNNNSTTDRVSLATTTITTTTNVITTPTNSSTNSSSVPIDVDHDISASQTDESISTLFNRSSPSINDPFCSPFFRPDAEHISLDPVVSVLDSIITDTVAETSPSNHNTTETNTDITTSTTTAPDAPTKSFELASSEANSITSTTVTNSHHLDLGFAPRETFSRDAEIGTFSDTNDTNNNSTSSSDNGSNDLLVDEFYTQPLHATESTSQFKQTIDSTSLVSDVSIKPPIVGETIEPKTTLPLLSTNPPEVQQNQFQAPKPDLQLKTPTIVEQIFQPLKPSTVDDSKAPVTENVSVQAKVTSTGVPSPTKPAPSTNKPSNISNIKGNNATKSPETKPKRTTTPRSRKKASTPSAAATPTPTTTVPANQVRPIQPQFISSSTQQQVLLQSTNGIRQPAIMGSSPMGNSIGCVPQQQRVIQIQTANGPMYFAIAPGPAANINNNSMMQQQPRPQQQTTGVQSQQYPSQQVCFQPNTTVMFNRPQLNQTMPQSPQRQSPQPRQPQPQQQQLMMSSVNNGNIIINGPPQMIQSQHQPRLAQTLMTGQNIVAPNQSNSQPQQHMMIPSSQPMMMPRMSNQIVLNRPVGGPGGPLLPGQQQFIQILTPNGPMLLALPPQSAQPVNNTMIENQNQVHQSPGQPLRQSTPIQQQQQLSFQIKSNDVTDCATRNVAAPNQSSSNSKSAPNSKSGFDLGDLLADCGILPEDKTASPSNISVNSSQSPTVSQMSSPMPHIPQNASPMSTTDSNAHPNSYSQQPMPNYAGQPTMQQQPVRITFGPDGQMIMQPAIYGAIRPVVSGSMAQPNPLNTIPRNNIISTMSMTSNSSSISTPITTTVAPSTPTKTSSPNVADSSKKTNSKGKGTAVKRSRPKKSDLDKFPQLKTPKIAQQKQLQAVTVLPMTMLVGDQNKVLAAGSDTKPTVAQLQSGQQVSLAKFITTPVMQSSPMQSSVNNSTMHPSITTPNMFSGQGTAIVQNQTQIVTSAQMNSQLVVEQGKGISAVDSQQQQSQDTSAVGSTIKVTAAQQISSSGNVQTNLLKRDDKSGTVESNPHISSSLMPHLTLTVDTLKIEQNGLKASDGQCQIQAHPKGLMANIGGTMTTTLVLRPVQQLTQSQVQQQNLARQLELRAQSILNQLSSDREAAVNPKTSQSFESLEDACKRLLRYHVFDADTPDQAKIQKVDEIFEAAVESLLTRKKAIYDKFRFLILNQSMESVPSSERVMMEQTYLNDEFAYLKKERQLFNEYEAHLESMTYKQAKTDSNAEEGYFAFGADSPKQKNQDVLDNVARSREVDDWLLKDKWAESRYPSVPDSEAATAIESILNDEIS